jgi:alpha-methylacyl-CoA racemase
MLLAFGMVAAILNAQATGTGQVVDAAMVDGVNAMMSAFHGLRAMGLHSDDTGASFLGGAAHFYDTYETSDRKFISVAAIEPQFYDELVTRAGLDRSKFAADVFSWSADDDTRSRWKELKQELASVFKMKTRDEWCEMLEGSDACFAPVLTLSEAPDHMHNKTRDAFLAVGGHTQAAPAPRFSKSRTAKPQPGVEPGTHSRVIQKAAGFSNAEIDALIACGAVFARE